MITRYELTQLSKQMKTEIESAKGLEELAELKVKYLGKKRGRITRILKNIAVLPLEERREAGKLANELKNLALNLFADKANELEIEQRTKRLAQEALDVTLPGKLPRVGRKHVLTQMLDEIIDVFLGMGFSVVEGPDVETDYYNFEALNMPKEHPARDMFDSFYITDELLLRSHTSPVQVRTMEHVKPPIRIIVPGKVYRPDWDITHTPMFHQVEGLTVDTSVTFAELKGTLIAFAKATFGRTREVRFRPSYFPFTEPSAEVDISCGICAGKGCRTCSGRGWLEILGAGMVDPAVFEAVGYDPDRYTGFAFGMGVERIAMLKYGVDDIRLFFENDIRFIEQF